MSPRAAWRLGQLGFDAYDYALGKSDWLSWNLGFEGTADLVGQHLTTDVPTCHDGATLADVRHDVRPDGADVAVVNDGRILLGRLTAERLGGADDDIPVTELMYEGPTTVRASTPVEQMLHRIQHAGVDRVFVTRPDGYLLGTFAAAVEAGTLPDG